MKATPNRNRAHLDRWRASFWRRVVWVNQVVPGMITMSVTDLKALSMADRIALFDAVEEVAEAQAAAMKTDKHEGDG